MMVGIRLLCQFIFTLNPFRKVRHILIDFGTGYFRIYLSSGNTFVS